MKSVLMTAYKNGQQHLNSAYVDTFSRKGFCISMSPVLDDLVSKENPLVMEDELLEIAEYQSNKNDILVLTGGRDMNPLVYGEPNYASENPDINRDVWELALFRAFKDKQKPIMGICRGFQLIGTQIGIPDFYQEIGKVPETHNANAFGIEKRVEPMHNVYLYGELDKFLKTKNIKKYSGIISTNSFHHQGFVISFSNKMNKIIDDTRVFTEKCTKIGVNILAKTDCILEGFSHQNTFAVQWHPEEYKNSNIIGYFLEKVC